MILRRGAATTVFVVLALLSMMSLVVLHKLLVTGANTYDVLVLPLPEDRESASNGDVTRHGTPRTTLSDSQPSKPVIFMHYGPAKTGTSTLQNEMTVWKDRIYQQDNMLYGGVYYNNLQWLGRLDVQKAFLDPGFACSREMARVRTRWEEETSDSFQQQQQQQGMLSLRETIRNIPCVKDLVQQLEPYRQNNTSLFFSNEVKSLTSSFKHIPGYPHKVTQDWLSIAAALGDDWNFVLVIGYRPYVEWVASAKSQNEKFTPTKPRLTKWPGQGGREFPPLFPPSTLVAVNNETRWDVQDSDLLVQRDDHTSSLQHSDLKTVLQRHLNFVSGTFQYATPVYEASHKYIPVRFLQLYDSIPIRTNMLCHILSPHTPNTCRASQEQDDRNGDSAISRVNEGSVVAERSWYDQLAVEAVKQNLVSRASVTRAQLTSQSMQYHQNILNGSKWDLPYLCPHKEALLVAWDISWEKERELLGIHANKTRHLDVFRNFVKEGKHCNIDARTAVNQAPWRTFFQKFGESGKMRYGSGTTAIPYIQL